MRGYFGIGIEKPNSQENIGTLYRSAYAFDADFMFTITTKYHPQKSDTVKSFRHIPYFHYPNLDDFHRMKPLGAKIIGVEIVEGARFLKNFVHPLQAIYLLGSEHAGLSKEALDLCDTIIKIPSKACLNVSTVGSIILYDRIAKADEQTFSPSKKRALITV